MSRTLLLTLAALVVASPAAAQLTSPIYVFTSEWYTAGGLAGVEAIDGFADIGPDYRWLLPGLTRADVGTTFELTEANSTSYGFDWQGADDYADLMSEYRHGEVRFESGMFINGVKHGDAERYGEGGAVNYDLVSVTYLLDRWNDGDVRQRTTFYFLAPEPASAAMLLFGLLLLPCHRYQTPHAPRK